MTLGTIYRALQFEVRQVYDSGNHVWLEIYSEKQQRWIHCDPTWKSFDDPLIYERNHEMNYYIAMSLDEARDVTPRYISDLPTTQSRRRKSSEWRAVQNELEKFNAKQSIKMTSIRRQELKQRHEAENQDFKRKHAAASSSHFSTRHGSKDGLQRSNSHHN
jgi:peptide-N4-(N-acetyl-beta-glucosaminyl)asparagine amidase